MSKGVVEKRVLGGRVLVARVIAVEGWEEEEEEEAALPPWLFCKKRTLSRVERLKQSKRRRKVMLVHRLAQWLNESEVIAIGKWFVQPSTKTVVPWGLVWGARTKVRLNRCGYGGRSKKREREGGSERGRDTKREGERAR